MEIPYGYCYCGCNQRTNLAPNNNKRLGWRKGEPIRFIRGHQCIKSEKRLFSSRGYELIRMPNHPKSIRGKVPAHIVMAEKALGKALPPGSQIHHFPHKGNFTNLVICQDWEYHILLHIRYRAFLACGNPNFRKCSFCKKYDDIKNLYCFPNRYQYHHRSCKQSYKKHRRLLKKQIKEAFHSYALNLFH